MRNLASIQKIKNIEPIPLAEKIEKAQVLGWSVVVKKGEFNIGDLCVYFEIDSILPPKPEFEFLQKSKYRIKTVRLRGQVSQGICFRLSILPKDNYVESQDVTNLLGITKYEPPIPAHLAGQIKGEFPSFIPKTDEVRIQTCPEILEKYQNLAFYATEKIDGTSMTVYVKDGDLEVCGRRFRLLFEENNTYWKTARDLNLLGKLKSTGEKYAIQGELAGEGINKNILKIHGQRLFVFNIYNFITGEYQKWEEVKQLCDDWGLETVPEVFPNIFLPKTVDQIIMLATRKSVINQETWAEGLVFRPIQEKFDLVFGRVSFKAVNPEFLLEYGEE